jgi:hypothetical protein
MKWLSAGLIFLNLSTVCAVLLGIAARGLGTATALVSLFVGAAAAICAFLGTYDPEAPSTPAPAPNTEPETEPEVKLSKRALRRLQKAAAQPVAEPITRYSYPVWFWFLAGCFAIFAVRSFCWLLYIDGGDLKIQSVNNLGDLALHVTYIKTFANGIALWPDNPIFPFGHLRYPAGVDLFNALLCLVHVDLIRGLVWLGLFTSLLTFYAFYRWGGAFGIAGFLFNGGLAGFHFLRTFEFQDYQGTNTIAWKSVPLSMFVTQRGLLYAIPAGLLLLWHWREKFFRGATVAGVDDSGARVTEPDDNIPPGTGVTDPGYNVASRDSVSAPGSRRRGPLPFWVELSLYASMPLFHVHTFLALTIVLVFLFGLESIHKGKFILDFGRKEGFARLPSLFWRPARWKEVLGDISMRKQIILLIGCALIPATFFVWLITDHFHAASMLKWQPGWVQNSGEFKMPFFTFWWVNFGIWFPLVLVLFGWCGWRAWKNRDRFANGCPEDLAFFCPAIAIFVLGMLVKTAPWEWDNLKLMFWGYFLVLPFLWKDLIALWPLPARAGVCVALFGSGFVSLFGGLASPGYGFANRAEVDGVAVGIRNLAMDARFAAYPTYNHPLLLQGRKVVLGYPGHLWTQGFDYHEEEAKLRRLMLGNPDWRQAARALNVRYIFWGREEKTNYPLSGRPWEQVLPKVASGDWGAIYDLGEAGSR